MERFWSKVLKTNNSEDCWNWTAGTRGNKYGAIKYKGKVIDAHRLSWMMANNNYNLTSEDYICHKCDNPKCVNPNHLFLGTAQINAKDAYDKGRVVMPVGNRYENGEQPSNKTISDELMQKVANEISKKEKSIIQICKDFKVPYQSVKDMRRKNSQSYKKIVTAI